MDGNRNPHPSEQGEIAAVKKALQQASLEAAQIGYINPHGTGSLIGDETELRALRHCGLGHAAINATKSLIGHGLSAAGTVEVIATLVQMQEQQLHPTRNLDQPIEAAWNWVLGEAREHHFHYALTVSIGFGGVNTALCLGRSAR